MSVGFQSSTRDDSTLTAWPMSGRWYGSLAQQWPASSATVLMLARVSSFRSIVGSMALRNVSLLMCILRNHVTRCMLSSGWLSSSAFLPVISSIKITPKLKTSTLVVTLPVTAQFTQIWKQVTQVRTILCALWRTSNHKDNLTAWACSCKISAKKNSTIV